MEDLKERIINQAIKMFIQYGIRSVSIDDICKQMGISKKTFYVYFAQKSDLIDAILSQLTTHICTGLQKQMEQKSMLEVMLDFAAKGHNLQELHRPPQVVFDLDKYYPQLMEKHKKLIEIKIKEIVAQSLHKGIAEGIFWKDLDVEVCAEIFAKLHQHVMDTVNLPNFKLKEHRRAIDCTINLLIRGIVSEQGAQQFKEILEKKNNNKTK